MKQKLERIAIDDVMKLLPWKNQQQKQRNFNIRYSLLPSWFWSQKEAFQDQEKLDFVLRSGIYFVFNVSLERI